MRNLLFKDSLELERTDACTVKSPWLSCWQMQSKTLNERCQAPVRKNKKKKQQIKVY